MALVTGDYNVCSRKGGVDLYFHTFVMWASDWGWIEQALHSRQSPPETEVFLLFSSSAVKHSPNTHKNVSNLVWCVS